MHCAVRFDVVRCGSVQMNKIEMKNIWGDWKCTAQHKQKVNMQSLKISIRCIYLACKSSLAVENQTAHGACLHIDECIRSENSFREQRGHVAFLYWFQTKRIKNITFNKTAILSLLAKYPRRDKRQKRKKPEHRINIYLTHASMTTAPKNIL